VSEEILIEVCEPHRVPSFPADRHVGGVVGPGVRERERAVLGDGEGSAGIRAPERKPADVPRQRLDHAVERDIADLRVSLVVILEVEAATVRAPNRTVHLAVQARSDDAAP
jgi:hypothetical protein